jgi:alpha-amylase
VFEERVQTTYGENIFITGSILQLGNWNTAKALALLSGQYSSTNPLWSVTIDLPVGTSFSYKFIKKGQDGSVIWESDPNRSYKVPGGCAGAKQMVKASWR